MKITLNWLNEYLDKKLEDAEKVAELLTMSGTEVKKLDKIGEKYKNIVIGQVIELEQHPDADKLSVCKIDVGLEDALNIVCGARNFKKGDKVVVALEGAQTFQGITIKRTKLRGVVSEGMLCSEAELGLSSQSEGIMILGDEYEVGKGFASSAGLNDVVFEMEVTPNRPDCLCVMGIARELSVLFGINFITPGYNWENEVNIDKNFEIIIKDNILCPRYSAKIFTDVPKKLSPDWLKNRLILCDYRPIDLVVDLTNYVMHETGQPLHAFDKDLLYSDKIIIRTAAKSEALRTIDDISRNLEEGMLLITDEKKAVAIAGIMGGKDTEISGNTINILLESANFSGPSIMRTSSFLGLRSEASTRFEKKIDPELTIIAIKRFEDLLVKISSYVSSPGIYDSYKKIKRERKINLRFEKIKNILGKELSLKEVSGILSGLGIKNNVLIPGEKIIDAIVPSSRYEDLEREIDLIEEIARIHGFENFKAEPPLSLARKGKYSFYQKAIKILRGILSDIGLYEVINYSFISEEWIKKIKLDQEGDYKNQVKILNPINEEFEFLRTSPMPLLLKNIINNINHEIKDIGIFEISKVFQKDRLSILPLEINILAVMISGKSSNKKWNKEDKNYDFYDLKSILEYIYDKFKISSGVSLKEKEHKFFNPVISADIYINNIIKIGIIGKIHPGIIDSLDLVQDVYYLELNLDSLIKNINTERNFKSIPAYPSINIDLALVVDEDIKTAEMENVIKESGTSILKSIELFDIYRGKQIEDGKKSMAYSLTFREDTRTLKDMEIEIIVKRILGELDKKFKAKIRV